MIQRWIFIFLMALGTSTLEAREGSTSFHPEAQRQGFYASLTTGSLYFMGGDRLDFDDGWLMGLKLGYDVWRYIGLEGQMKMSFHNTSQCRVGATIPCSFINYQFIGMLKLNYPITSRLYAGAGAGGGIWYSDPNMKPTVGSNSRSIFSGTASLEYFMRTRGLSIGLDPTLSGVTDLKSVVGEVTGFVRYTF